MTASVKSRCSLIWIAAVYPAMVAYGGDGPSSIAVVSPDGRSTATIATDASGRLSYALTRDGAAVLGSSAMGVTVDRIALGRGVTLGSPIRTTLNETYPWRGVHSVAVGHCNEATIPVTHTASGRPYDLVVRAYDDGMAYRYIVPGDSAMTVTGEDSAWNIPSGSLVWFQRDTLNYEGFYTSESIDTVCGKMGAPLVVELPGGGGYAAITEAALYGYSGMSLRVADQCPPILPCPDTRADSPPVGAGPGAGRSVVAYFEDDCEWQGAPVITPWRVTLVSSDLDGLVNSDVISHLNPPPTIVDTSWIRPGRALWSYWKYGHITYEHEIRYIDQAAELGFEYTLLDAGWWSSMTEFDNTLAHARDKGIGVWIMSRTSPARTT